jgi:hypothetical protein
MAEVGADALVRLRVFPDGWLDPASLFAFVAKNLLGGFGLAQDSRPHQPIKGTLRPPRHLVGGEELRVRQVRSYQNGSEYFIHVQSSNA